MSRYKAYPAYKDSGVEMLGVLPASWGTQRVRFLLKDGADGIKIGPFGSALKLEDMVEEGFRVYGQENVIQRNFDLGSRRISDKKFAEMAAYEACRGDALITMMGTSGKCILVDKDAERGIIDSHLLRLRIDEYLIVPEFFRLLIDESLEVEHQIKMSGKGSIMHGLNSSIVKSLQLPLPTIDEQKAILRFLDHETAKIDALIEKQQRLIELLKEKRQAVISHAVTKGLNPNAPMKDSGVEWLGEVPAHWEVKSLRYLGGCQNGINIGADYFGSGYPFVSYGDVYRNETLPHQVDGLVESSDSDREVYSVQTGDVFFTRTSETIDEIGFSSVCERGIEDATFAGFLIRFRPTTTDLSIGYSKYYFRSNLLRAYFVQEMNLVTRASLSQDLLKKLSVPLPPTSEQAEISAILDTKSEIFSRLISNAEIAVQLLQERRTALISAAVTGKIDVRDWQPAAA